MNVIYDIYYMNAIYNDILYDNYNMLYIMIYYMIM